MAIFVHFMAFLEIDYFDLKSSQTFSCSVCYYVTVYEEYGMSCGDYTIIFYAAAARS